MRLVRVGEPTSGVGRDLRAALTSWGRGDAVAGGVALLGVRPPEFGSPVEAVVITPRGVLVVLGVDLPRPAVWLSAPLGEPWRADGAVPQVGDRAPGDGALAATAAVAAVVRRAQPRPLPVSTVVAVGPYVGRVDQPATDLERGVRILHPAPTPLLTVTRELTTHSRPCPVDELRRILHALHADLDLDDADLVAEGFPDGMSAAASAERTTILPPVPGAPPRPAPTPPPRRRLPIAIGVLVALLLVAGVALAVAAADGGPPIPHAPPAPAPQQGLVFTPRGEATQTDCATHTSGQLRTWLERNGCAELLRGRFEATENGRRAAVLVGVVRISGSASAVELRALADRPDTGAVVDQSAEGVAWPTTPPPTFDAAARASDQEGNSVKLVQAVWLDQPSRPDDPALLAIADRALRLSLAG
ncbi:hypothetical protein V5P93_001559 [Actinokineospora auranticolor]|uniref:NERD domain-containing protein n=1 Tax=Actinokineospora auranticolor TaxID=155976 RepID=A0A2S6GVL2_9PSEU|nr:hypothetical protein [Actinokineospora auranticolor]PPK69181.1 hypothetical protein CLV40_104434 [Actinokineospora auranticolor]